jgi:hypothetical protein
VCIGDEGVDDLTDDSTTTGGGPVFRLIYRSRLTIPAENFKAEVANILRAPGRRTPSTGSPEPW